MPVLQPSFSCPVCDAVQASQIVAKHLVAHGHPCRAAGWHAKARLVAETDMPPLMTKANAATIGGSLSSDGKLEFDL